MSETESALQRVPNFQALPIANLLRIPHHANRSYEELARRISAMTDEQLEETIRLASEASDLAWWLRGQCVAEVKHRIRERGDGAQGKKDASGTGITKTIEEIAKNIGVHPRTLDEDCRIVEALRPVLAEKMIVSDAGSETIILPPRGLSKDICDAISREKDVDRAIDVAADLITPSRPTPTLGDFKNSLLEVKRGKLVAGTEPPVSKDAGDKPATARATPVTAIEWKNVPLSLKSLDQLDDIRTTEALPTLESTIEWCVDQVFKALRRSRQPDRIPGQDLDFDVVPTERAA